MQKGGQKIGEREKDKDKTEKKKQKGVKRGKEVTRLLDVVRPPKLLAQKWEKEKDHKAINFSAIFTVYIFLLDFFSVSKMGQG